MSIRMPSKSRTDLAESGLDRASCQCLREQAALWRFVHVAGSQAQAEDELTAALHGTRQPMPFASPDKAEA
jgi:hypothetical protein